MALNPHLDTFMQSFPHEGLTFDDLSLVTRYSDFLPAAAVISSRLTTRVQLNIPFVSAAMDTVTESGMAISMAMLGGIGVIHKNLSPRKQAAMVQAVKQYLNGLIATPVVFQHSQTLPQVEEARSRHSYPFSGFPIIDDDGKLVGILTSRDVRFASRSDALISDVMTRDPITAAPGTTLKQAYAVMQENKVGKLPLVDANGHLVGLYSFSDVSTLIHNVQPLYNRDDQYRLRVAAAIGPGDEARAETLIDKGVDVLVVDTAHGHSEGVIAMTRWVKQHAPDVDVVAGNIATGEAALALRKAGADAVKVGIGPGSICTTRVVAGVGVPQISAIYACAHALEGSLPVIADGGIRHSGDVPKALAAGADSVMMGGVLAGTDESPGEKIIHQGRQYVIYRGMGSLDAMKTRAGSRERYGQGSAADDDLVPQGIEGMVAYAGKVERVMGQYCGGLRAGLGYCGCRTLDDLQRNAQFVRVSHAGVIESHPHGVQITKESPNYRS